MKMKKVFVLIILVTGITCSVQAQNDELEVLFVGNSYIYSNNLPHIVSLISEGTAVKLHTRKSVIGGARLDEHWKGSRGLKTREMIETGNYDIVILQDHSLSMRNHPDSTQKYVRLFTELIQSQGAEVYLFNTWARKKVPQFQEEIDAMYSRASTSNGIKRIPVGTAWQKAMDIRPTVELFTPDGSHPSELGTLLTACVIVKYLSGELPEPVDMPFSITDQFGESVILMHMDWLDREFCRRVAGEIIPLRR